MSESTTTIDVFELMEQLCQADEVSDEEPHLVAGAQNAQDETVKVEEQIEAGHDAPPHSEDPFARHEVEHQLEQIFLRLTTELSDLTWVKLLPKAKVLYETLHPETRHGGPRRGVKTRRSERKRVARMAAWPSFSVHLAERWGVSERTAYRRIEAGEALEKLDAEAEQLCYGTPLASKLGLLVRVAALPKPELHRDLVNILLRSQKEGLAELYKWEDVFGLSKPKPPKPEDEEKVADADDATDPGDNEAEDDSAADDGAVAGDDDGDDDVVVESGAPEDDAATDPNIATIIEVLGVSAATECVAAIQELQATGQQLRMQLQAVEKRESKLQAELKVYRDSQLGQLFALLGAKTAGQALAKARVLKGGRDAA